MINRRKQFSNDAINVWPDVFETVSLNVLPFQYVDVVLINFKDGKSWEIEITSKDKKNKFKDIEKGLFEIFKSYDERINEVDVKINTNKVKKDVEKSIKRMLKRINL